jgi:hypothetical protein
VSRFPYYECVSFSLYIPNPQGVDERRRNKMFVIREKDKVEGDGFNYTADSS